MTAQMKIIKFPVEVVGSGGTSEIKISAKADDGKLSSLESFSLNVRPRGVEQNLHLTFNAGETLNSVIERPHIRSFFSKAHQCIFGLDGVPGHKIDTRHRHIKFCRIRRGRTVINTEPIKFIGIGNLGVDRVLQL